MSVLDFSGLYETFTRSGGNFFRVEWAHSKVFWSLCPFLEKLYGFLDWKLSGLAALRHPLWLFRYSVTSEARIIIVVFHHRLISSSLVNHVLVKANTVLFEHSLRIFFSSCSLLLTKLRQFNSKKHNGSLFFFYFRRGNFHRLTVAQNYVQHHQNLTCKWWIQIEHYYLKIS